MTIARKSPCGVLQGLTSDVYEKNYGGRDVRGWMPVESVFGPPPRACIRSVAGCATPTGSAGHAGATANLKLTFHLDHSAGADHPARR